MKLWVILRELKNKGRLKIYTSRIFHGKGLSLRTNKMNFPSIIKIITTVIFNFSCIIFYKYLVIT